MFTFDHFVTIVALLIALVLTVVIAFNLVHMTTLRGRAIRRILLSFDKKQKEKKDHELFKLLSLKIEHIENSCFAFCAVDKYGGTVLIVIEEISEGAYNVYENDKMFLLYDNLHYKTEQLKKAFAFITKQVCKKRKLSYVSSITKKVVKDANS